MDPTPPPSPTAVAGWRQRLPFFYGWLMVAVGFTMMFVSNGINWSIGVIANPMREDLGWTATDVFGGLTLRILFSALGAVALARFADSRLGARRSVAITGVIIMCCLALTSRVQEVWQFWLLLGVVTGFCSGGHALLFTAAVIPRWFRRSRGRALALATMGSSTAAFVLPPIVASVISNFGWQTAWLSMAVLALFFSVLPSFLVVRQPEDLGMLPDGRAPDDADTAPGAPAGAASTPEVSIDAHTAVRSRLFWLLVITISLAITSSISVPAAMAPMYEWKGFSPHLAATAFSVYGLFSVSSRYFWGWLADRVPLSVIAMGVGLFNAAIFPLLIVVSGDVAYVYAALVGLGVSGLVMVQSLIWPYYFGRGSLGAIIGVSRPFPVVMSSAGVLLMSQSFDQTGGYTLALLVMSAMAAMSAATMFVAARTPAPRPAA